MSAEFQTDKTDELIQRLTAERDAAIAERDRRISLCRSLAHLKDDIESERDKLRADRDATVDKLLTEIAANTKLRARGTELEEILARYVDACLTQGINLGGITGDARAALGASHE